MINFKATNFDGGFFSIEKPASKHMSLKIGEIIRAGVMDILPAGGVTLKIKGSVITAKSGLEQPLEKGAVAFFKVTGQPGEGRELRLQFMGYNNFLKDFSSGYAAKDNAAITKLIQQLSNVLKNKETSMHISKLQPLISKLMSMLPSDINSLSEEVKTQLLNLLKTSLKATGQSIHARIDNFISQTSDVIKNHPSAANLNKVIMVNIEKLLPMLLKVALQDTGIALEAKLKTIAQLFQKTELPTTGEKELTKISPQSTSLSDAKQSLQQSAVSLLKNDLKANLLQLRQFLIEEISLVSSKPLQSFELSTNLPLADRQSLLKIIDGLLRDIETFQLLSKATNSLYTFLPIGWRAMKDGDIAFKKRFAGAEGISHSCKINLDLEKFGKITITAFMFRKDFLLTFQVESLEFRSVLNSHLDNLQDAFRAGGLNIKSINILDINDTSLSRIDKAESFGNVINIEV